VMDILTSDHKLNMSAYYMNPGFAFGGSCLPKDTKGLKHLARSLGVDIPMIGHLNESNSLHIDYVVGMIKALGKKTVGICGLTFKADTDDMRGSPNLILMKRLIESGLQVTFYDPLVRTGCSLGDDENLRVMVENCRSVHMQEFVDKSEILVVSHEDEYSNLACTLANENHHIIELECHQPKQASLAQRHGLSW